jgi:CheY-like chemotaxis protein
MSRRVLLVDDEDDIRAVAQLSLESVGGWEVVTAGSGADALRQAQGASFDAILLDVMMPGLDGPTTLERLRAAGVDTPVVFLTAKVQPGDRRELETAGAAGILAKPFDPMRLADDLDRVLERAP